MNRSFIAVLVATLVGCQGKAASATTHQSAVQDRSAAMRAAGADSARAFVQWFYDWYLATEDQKGSPYDSLLTTRRSVLGDSLREALAADVAAQRADTTGDIVSLTAEADAFLNSQDPCAHYTAQPPRPIGGGRVAVRVAGDCSGLDAKPNLEVELRPAGTGWQIENIKDPSDPTFDLTRALRRWHESDVVPGSSDSARKDDARPRTHNVSLKLSGYAMESRLLRRRTMKYARSVALALDITDPSSGTTD